MELRRDVGLVGLTFVAVSGVIGSGWLFAPLLASQLAGPAALVAWVIGGFGMLLLALTFAEVTAMLPVAGGIARVPQFSHGNVVSMAMGWSAWVGYLTTAPIEVEAMLRYLAASLSWLYVSGDHERLSTAGVVVAALLLALFTVINAFGVRFFALINTTITWAKLVIPIVVVLALVGSRFETTNFSADGGFAPFGIAGILAAVSSGGVVFSFIGFRHAIDLAGEARNPHFTLPAALLLAILICFLVYGGIQLAFVGALFPANLADGWAQLTFSHQLGPLGALASAIGILWLISLLNVGAVVSPFGGGLVAVGSNARLALALAQNGFFPSLLERLSERGVPLFALLLNFAAGCLFLIFMPFGEIVALNGAAIVLSFVVGPIAVSALRRLLPERRRAFRVPLLDLVAPAAFVVATLIIYWSGWDVVWRLGVCLLVGGALFALRILRDRERHLNLAEARWLPAYLLGVGVLSLLGTFGGGLGVLPVGLDLLVIAAFSIAVFLWAVRCRLNEQELRAYLAQEQL